MKMMTLPRFCLFLALVCPGIAWGASSCTINTATGPSFATYDAQGPNATAPLDATGTLNIQCNGAADQLTVAFDQGGYAAAGSSCALPLRQMGQGAARLRYDLYRDAARSLVWGCTLATSDSQVLANGATTNNFTIYARIPPGQTPDPGTYVDGVGVIVTF